MFLGTGEISQSKRECHRSYYPDLGVDGCITATFSQRLGQLHVDAAMTASLSEHVGLENEADLRLTVPLDLSDSREREYSLDDRVVVFWFRPDHYVKISNGLPASASTSRKFGSDDSRNRRYSLFESLAVKQPYIHPAASLVASQQLDSIKVLLLALIAKPRQRRDMAHFASCLQ